MLRRARKKSTLWVSIYITVEYCAKPGLRLAKQFQCLAEPRRPSTGTRAARLALIAIVIGGWTVASTTAQTKCGDRAATVVQVLGSGGPMHGGGRGSASYLLWHKGRPMMLIDAGAGMSVALARAGADEADLDTILITHLHPDHVSDLPDLLWGMSVENRLRPLEIVGPSGEGDFPGFRTFLARMFGSAGAFPFMKDVLDGREFPLQLDEVDATHGRGSEKVPRDGDLNVFAYPVEHGKAPTVAYRIDGPDFSVVFGADQTARDRGFARFAAGADLLVLHAILNTKGRATQLAGIVALPEDLAETAAEAHPKRLLLGHLMSQSAWDSNQAIWSLVDLPSISAAIRARYRGPFQLASDFACYPIPGGRDDPR